MLFLSVSLRFNGLFPGEHGLASVYWSKGWWKLVTTGAISRAKLQSNHHHQQTNTQAGCPSCRPTNSVKALKGKALNKALKGYVCSMFIYKNQHLFYRCNSWTNWATHRRKNIIKGRESLATIFDYCIQFAKLSPIMKIYTIFVTWNMVQCSKLR